MRSKDRGEQYQCPHNPAFRVIALPSFRSVPAQTHLLHRTFTPAFLLIDPDRLATAQTRASEITTASSVVRQRSFLLHPDSVNDPLDWFGELDVAEVMLLAFWNLEVLLQLHYSLLEVVMVDMMAVAISKALFASLESNTLPVLPVAFG